MTEPNGQLAKEHANPNGQRAASNAVFLLHKINHFITSEPEPRLAIPGSDSGSDLTKPSLENCQATIQARESEKERASELFRERKLETEMGQIVKRKKKGRPSKADLARRPISPPTATESEIRRSMRRRNVRYDIDYYEDYFDEEDEDEEEEIRREKKLKLVDKLNQSSDSAEPAQSRSRSSARSQHASDDEEEEEDKPLKKRKINGGDLSETEEEEEENNYDDEQVMLQLS